MIIYINRCLHEIEHLIICVHKTDKIGYFEYFLQRPLLCRCQDLHGMELVKIAGKSQIKFLAIDRKELGF